MMPKPRPRRRSGWLFGRRGNRRVRLTGSSLPSAAGWLRGVVKRSARTSILVGIALGCALAAFGVQRFLTRSSHFAVRALRFSPTRHVTAESLSARAGEVAGQNLFAVDLEQLQRDVLQEPWVASAHARRELPATIMVDVVEREPACSVALGPLYLADERGNVFKRANPDEAAALPVVTGVERELYLGDPEAARQQIRQVLAALDAWKDNPARPAVGEAHFDKLLGVTFYMGAVGVRLGSADLEARMRRFDAVWSALQSAGEKPRLIYLDNRARPDRVTVKLAAPPPAPAKKAGRAEPVHGEDGEAEKDT